MNKSINNKTPKIVGAITISAVVLITIFTLFSAEGNKDSETTITTSSTIITPTVSPTTTPATGLTTADQSTTKSQTVTYSIPKGHNNSIVVTVKLDDRVINSVSVDHSYDPNSESTKYISSFNENLNNAISGGDSIDDLDEIQIGRASITSEAFYQALNLM